MKKTQVMFWTLWGLSALNLLLPWMIQGIQENITSGIQLLIGYFVPIMKLNPFALIIAEGYLIGLIALAFTGLIKDKFVWIFSFLLMYINLFGFLALWFIGGLGGHVSMKIGIGYWLAWILAIALNVVLVKKSRQKVAVA